MSLQLATVIGNTTKDAEKKVSKDGVSYVTFRVAVSRADNTTTFYNVLVFGRYGDILLEQVTKGREVYVNGKLEISDKGYVSLIADHVELLRHPKTKSEKIEPEKTEEKVKTKK